MKTNEHDAWKAYCEQMKSGDTAWVNLPNGCAAPMA